MYGNEKYGPFNGSQSGYSKTGKMEKSLLNFGLNYEEERVEVVETFPDRFSDGKINMRHYMNALTS